MEFRELSDYAWKPIRPLPLPNARTGRRRTDDRLVLDCVTYLYYISSLQATAGLIYPIAMGITRRLKEA
ncbi:MAG: hypothetical protein QXI39_07225 [Candidatus Bathyarchaeia archaeon]